MIDRRAEHQPLKPALRLSDAGFPPSQSTILLTVVVAAFALRAYVTFGSGAVWINTDTVSYLQMADGILTGRPFSYFPNGYPLLIAATKWAVGDGMIHALVALNVALSTLVVYLCFRIGVAVGSPTAGIIGAALVAIWPNQINYVRQVMSEVPCTALLVMGVLLLLRRHHLAAGLCIAGAATFRSSLVVAVPMIAIWAIAAGSSRRQVAALLTGCALVLGGMIGLERAGVVAPAANSGPNLLIAVAPVPRGEIDFTHRSFTEAEVAHPLRTYVAFAIQQPLEFAHQRLRSAWELWGPWPQAGDLANPRSFLSRLAIGIRLPLLIAALVVLCQTPRWFDGWLLIIPALSISVVHVMFFSTPRFSYPAEPFLLVLSAVLYSRVAYARPASHSA